MLEDKKRSQMQNAINTLMLVCASLAAMAFGVLAAYCTCRAGFAILRVHARSVTSGAEAVRAQREPQVARLT
jgi:hypothetical protein